MVPGLFCLLSGDHLTRFLSSRQRKLAKIDSVISSCFLSRLFSSLRSSQKHRRCMVWSQEGACRTTHEMFDMGFLQMDNKSSICSPP